MSEKALRAWRKKTLNAYPLFREKWQALVFLFRAPLPGAFFLFSFEFGRDNFPARRKSGPKDDDRMKNFLLLALAVALLAGCGKAAMQERALEAIRENPDALIEALSKREAALFELVAKGQQAYQELQEQKRIQSELAKPFAPSVDPERPILGPASAPSLVVVYSDFLCPYCSRGAAVIRSLAMAHPDDVRVLFKHFVLHKAARPAALYFEAIGLQSPQAAWDFHDQVFARQDDFSKRGEAVLKDIARGLPIDQARLARDLKRKELSDRLDADYAEAGKFGFDGTPTFLVNGVSVRGAAPLSDFENILGMTKTGKPLAAARPDGVCLDCLND